MEGTATAGSGVLAPDDRAGDAIDPVRGPESSAAVDTLNPRRCAGSEPFVLSIAPGGSSGEITGWLESAPMLAFDQQLLPRFGAYRTDDDGDPEADLAMWWSIGSVDDQTLWVYTANAASEIAHVTVHDVSEIGDARELDYAQWEGGLGSAGELQLQELAVFHHKPSDRYVALQVVDVYVAEDTEDSYRRDICAAIDARWFVAPPGSADFSVFH